MLKTMALTGAMLMMTGCLFTVDSDHRSDAASWNEHDVARIVRGQTSESWVRTSFGEPMRTTVFEDGTQVWHYTNTAEEDTEVGLFLLFHIDVEREVRQDLSIEFSQGVVTDYWVKERRS